MQVPIAATLYLTSTGIGLLLPFGWRSFTEQGRIERCVSTVTRFGVSAPTFFFQLFFRITTDKEGISAVTIHAIF